MQRFACWNLCNRPGSITSDEIGLGGIPSGTRAHSPRRRILTTRVCSRRILGTPSSSPVARLRCSHELRALPSPSQAGRNRGWSYACESTGDHRIGLPATGQHACLSLSTRKIKKVIQTLPLDHHALKFIIQDHHFDTDAELRSSSKFHGRHAE